MYCQLEEGGLVYVHSAICETFWCSSILYIYDQLERSTSALSICALCYMLNIFSVVVLHRSMVNWRRAVLGTCALCYLWKVFGVAVFHTSMFNWRGGLVHLPSVYVHSAICETSIHVWSIGGRYICTKYICIVVYVKCIQCSGIPYIYGQLDWGAFCYMWNLFSVVVFHRCIVKWRRGALVYVHAAICETFLV